MKSPIRCQAGTHPTHGSVESVYSVKGSRPDRDSALRSSTGPFSEPQNDEDDHTGREEELDEGEALGREVLDSHNHVEGDERRRENPCSRVHSASGDQ